MDFFDSAPPGWRLATLAELGEVNRGRSRHRPRHDPVLYGGPYPFIQTGDVKAAPGRVNRHKQTYSEAGLAQSRLWPEDTMCITIAANIAETALLSYPACFPDSVIGFIPEPATADVHFVEYAFRNLKRLVQHVSRDSGTVQDNINLEFLGDLRFPVPVSVDEQRSIASILQAFDDRIDHARRQSQLLEAYARTLFTSWFVDYEPVTARTQGKAVPGVASAIQELFPSAFDDSNVGSIPAGWRVDTFSALAAQVESGSRPRGGVAGFKEGIPSLGAEHITPLGTFDYSDVKYVPVEFFDQMKRGIVRPRDVAMYKDGAYIGRTTMWDSGFPFDQCCANEHVFLMRAADGVGPEFLYFWLTDQSNNAEVVNLNTNSAQPGLSQAALETLDVVLPPPSLLKVFTEITSPLIDGVFRNARLARDLGRTRDQLIAPLVTGEVRISVGTET